MPTIIDALLVTLGLDDSQFQKARERSDADWKKTRDNATRAGKEQEEAARKAALAMSKLRGDIVSVGLAFLGAKSIKDFAVNTVNNTAAIGRFSQATGESTNVVNSWGDVIKAAGGDAQEAMAIFGKLSNMRADFQRHPENFANNPAFRQLFSGSMGSVRGMFQGGGNEVLLHLADQYQNELAKARASGNPNAEGDLQASYRQRLQELLGMSDAWVTALEAGRPALQKQLDFYQKQDQLLKSDADAARDFQTQFGRVSAVVTRVGRDVLTPTLGFVADAMDKLTGSSEPTGQYLRNVALGFEALMHPLDALIQYMANKGLIKQTTADSLESFAFSNTRKWAEQGPGAAGRADAPGYTGPGGGGGGGGMVRGSGAGVGNTADGSATIQRFFNLNGFSAEQARGLAAGIAAEGGTLGMSQNGAFGIGQWRGARLDRLRAQYGRAPSFQQQLQFMLQELHGGDPGGAAVRRQTTAAGVASSYISQFMRPQGKFIASAGRYEHQADLNNDLARARNFLAAHSAAVGQTGGNVTVTVHAPGHPDPHKVAHKTASAVKKVAQGRSRVANANGGLN